MINFPSPEDIMTIQDQAWYPDSEDNEDGDVEVTFPENQVAEGWHKCHMASSSVIRFISEGKAYLCDPDEFKDSDGADMSDIELRIIMGPVTQYTSIEKLNWNS